jgi:hypothetical protein
MKVEILKHPLYIRVFHKLWRLRGENDQFWHNRASNVKRVTRNENSRIKLVFLPIVGVSSASTAAAYIFTAPTCKTTMISLELCASD